MNQQPDYTSQDRVERWLQAKFQSAGREYLQQMPKNFRVASLSVQCTESAPLFPVSLRWASAIILATITIGLWWSAQPQSKSITQLTAPVPNAAPAIRTRAAQNTGIVNKRPTPFLATNNSNTPAVAPSYRAVPNSSVLNNKTSGQTEQRLVINHSNNLPASGSGLSRGPVIQQWPIVKRGSVMMTVSANVTGTQPERAPTAVIQSTENGLALLATDLSPSTEYTVWIQRRGATTPTQVGLDVSDESGALAMNLPATVLPGPVMDNVASPLGLMVGALPVADMSVGMKGSNNAGSLVFDVAIVFVLDEATGEIVVQTQLP